MRGLSALAERIDEPVAKLRFIQRALERYHRQPALLRKIPGIRALGLRLASFDAFSELLNRADSGTRPEPPRFPWLLYRARHPLLGLVGLSAAFALLASAGAVYSAAASGLEQVSAFWQTARGGGPVEQPPAPPSPSSPLARTTPAPLSIWLVEERSEGELWSNGLRVLTSYQTRTEPRRYLRFPKAGGPPELESKPVGILFHSTENDMAPFEPGFNRNILQTTQSLLGYLQRRGLYHYLIDRFGRVYRLVVDPDVATHAGKSVWADESWLYVNLSESFIGVSFESQWSPTAGELELLTPPQIQSGLNLTDMLRARYGIADENCTTHGLVSVNATKMLIGHHRDWARGFPFAAFGLTDKYNVLLPSVLELGFHYDEHFLAEMKGALWPGLQEAEIELRKRAAERGLGAEDLRKEQRRRYAEHLAAAEVLRDPKLSKSRPAPRSANGGGRP
jgi:hypothetical protein